jgi:hypothetical protein
VPVGRRHPCETQFGGALAKIVGRIGQPLDVDSEQRIERLDFDVEPFHQWNGHRPQIRQSAANRHLRDRSAPRVERRRERGQLVAEPVREIFPARHLLGPWAISITPGLLARAQQRSVAHERNARGGLFERHVGFDRARRGERLTRSRQRRERVGGRQDRLNPNARGDERLRGGRNCGAVGQRQHDRVPHHAFLDRADGRDVGQHAVGVDAGAADRGDRLGPHPLVRSARHHHLPVIARRTPDDQRDTTTPERPKAGVGVGARSGPHGVGPYARLRLAGNGRPRVQLDDAAGGRRQLDADAGPKSSLVVGSSPVARQVSGKP